ncbi:MAG: hypothetical protein ACD_76C00163G0002 [uncultured bacterium]|nr:MAG: hypothetical protein ACD_76C00163G0002 [uncultured bacterium]HBD05384.1 hypothetical protein [Candidatus Uhrbacteria bacterium]
MTRGENTARNREAAKQAPDLKRAKGGKTGAKPLEATIVQMSRMRLDLQERIKDARAHGEDEMANRLEKSLESNNARLEIAKTRESLNTAQGDEKSALEARLSELEAQMQAKEASAIEQAQKEVKAIYLDLPPNEKLALYNYLKELNNADALSNEMRTTKSETTKSAWKKVVAKAKENFEELTPEAQNIFMKSDAGRKAGRAELLKQLTESMPKTMAYGVGMEMPDLSPEQQAKQEDLKPKQEPELSEAGQEFMRRVTREAPFTPQEEEWFEGGVRETARPVVITEPKGQKERRFAVGREAVARTGGVEALKNRTKKESPYTLEEKQWFAQGEDEEVMTRKQLEQAIGLDETTIKEILPIINEHTGSNYNLDDMRAIAKTQSDYEQTPWYKRVFKTKPIDISAMINDLNKSMEKTITDLTRGRGDENTRKLLERAKARKAQPEHVWRGRGNIAE